MITLSKLVQLLNDEYLFQYNTKIIGGFVEPYYKAQSNSNPAEIQFSHDYIRSALHELAHWCVAGVERRQVDDYGYWYRMDRVGHPPLLRFVLLSNHKLAIAKAKADGIPSVTDHHNQ